MFLHQVYGSEVWSLGQRSSGQAPQEGRSLEMLVLPEGLLLLCQMWRKTNLALSGHGRNRTTWLQPIEPGTKFKRQMDMG